MKHQNFYPSGIAKQIAWNGNYADKIALKGAVLGLTPDQVAAIVADCLWLIYVLQHWADSVTSFSSGCSKTTLAAQTGTGNDVMVLNTHTAPALPPGVTPQLPGSLTRIMASVQLVKNSGKCDDATAVELGIVGSVMVGPDLTVLMPLIHVLLMSGHVVIKWGWQGFGLYLSSCEIWVDRGDGKGFVFLTIDTTPNYTDTQPLPAVAAKWTYKAIYRMDEAQAGLWSAPVSISVVG
jgi:hypothetical protein